MALPAFTAALSDVSLPTAVHERNLPVNDALADPHQIKLALNRARSRILGYTGLDASDDLISAVLAACSEAASGVPSPLLEEALCRMVDRCQRLVDVTNRFVVRDFELIALSRRAIATVDLFQDVITAYQTALPCTKTLT